jgi:hypothetical protein
MEAFMSNTNSLNAPIGFGEATTDRLSVLGNTVVLYWQALREGLAAASEYEGLIARGVPHDDAVRRVFNEHFSS